MYSVKASQTCLCIKREKEKIVVIDVWSPKLVFEIGVYHRPCSPPVPLGLKQTFTRWLTFVSLGSGGCAEGQSQLACAFQSRGNGPKASLALDFFTWLTGQSRERHVSSPLYLLVGERHRPSSLQRLDSSSPMEYLLDVWVSPCHLTLGTRGGPLWKSSVHRLWWEWTSGGCRAQWRPAHTDTPWWASCLGFEEGQGLQAHLCRETGLIFSSLGSFCSPQQCP